MFGLAEIYTRELYTVTCTATALLLLFFVSFIRKFKPTIFHLRLNLQMLRIADARKVVSRVK